MPAGCRHRCPAATRPPAGPAGSAQARGAGGPPFGLRARRGVRIERHAASSAHDMHPAPRLRALTGDGAAWPRRCGGPVHKIDHQVGPARVVAWFRCWHWAQALPGGAWWACDCSTAAWLPAAGSHASPGASKQRALHGDRNWRVLLQQGPPILCAHSCKHRLRRLLSAPPCFPRSGAAPKSPPLRFRLHLPSSTVIASRASLPA